MSTEPSCDFCNKQGLPILPVRYALAPIEAKAPRLSGNLRMPKEIAVGRFGYYTARLLRDGFVYVFDEARKHWSGYYATEKGYYLRFDISKPLPLAFRSAEPCARSGHPEVAGCITVSSPKQASTIWLGFSDSQWTPAVLARHQTAEYRKRHMRAFDVKAWLGAQDGPHAAKISEVTTRIAEYSAAVATRQFAFSAADFQARSASAPGLLQAAERMQPGKGAIVALDDPAGIAQDLAQLMQAGVKSFVSRPEYKRKLALSTAIGQLREGIQNQGELGAIANAQRDARNAVNPGYGGGGSGGGAANAGMALARAFNKQLDTDLQAMEERMRTLTPGQLDTAGNQAWGKYAAKYDEQARATWQAGFDAKLKQFDRIFVAPLAKSHADWMRSTALANQFICNHDADNSHSGLGYAAAFALCIEGTQDKKACSDIYTKWLNGKATDERNLGLRALLLNQDNLVAQAAKAEGGLDPRSVPWDALIGAYDKTMEAGAAAGQAVVARLLMQLGGPLLWLLDKGIDGPVRQGLIAVGMAGQAPIVRVTITGGRKTFRAAVIRQLLALHGNRIDRNAIQRAVSAELRRLQMRGVPMAGATRKTFLALADPAIVKGMPSGLSHQQRANWLATSLRTVEQYEATELSRWKRALPTRVRLGTVGGILQVLAFSKVSEDRDGAMAHEKTDQNARYWAGVIAIGGTTSDVIGHGLASAAEAGSLRYAPNAAKTLGKLMSRWGGRANVVAAVVMAIMDGSMAYKENAEGNFGMAMLYVGSAFLGVGALVAFAWFGLTVGIIVVILFVIVAVLVEVLKDNKLQDWLERTVWGVLPRQRYTTMGSEQGELKLALAG